MKCEDVRHALVDYWDLPDHDIRRLKIDHHVKQCASCQQEYELWKASREWMHDAQHEFDRQSSEPSAVTSQVMQRIYQTDGWRLPIERKGLALSFRQRFSFAVLLSFFLAVFLFSFVHLAMQEEVQSFNPQEMLGFVPVASNEYSQGAVEKAAFSMEGIVVASVGEPYLLSMDGMEQNPNYFMIFSLFGFISVIFLLNWLSRIRS
ncbi:anti-sigma factor family protein [Marinicrinis sediminis]|uniref:Anti-sigma factor family protein n=1 Tax=Marinicrinis sediminis TaxID=1652465 RepID=A0ABW5RFV6_9BACL